MEARDYRLVLVGNTQVGLFGLKELFEGLKNEKSKSEAVIKGCIYNHPALTLTIRNEAKLITLHAKHASLTLIEDEKEAQELPCLCLQIGR